MNICPFYTLNSKASQVDGIITAQTLRAFDELKKIIKDFDTIIEIGYHCGGLTYWFHKNKKEDAKVFSFDICDDNRQVFEKEINFHVADCFEKTTIDKIKNLILNGKKTLIFCDGGNKNSEFNCYSEFLKTNDVIMLHDYFDDSQPEPYASFEESKEWNFPWESNWSKIQKSVEKNNLSKFYYEDFRKVLIGSFKKT